MAKPAKAKPEPADHPPTDIRPDFTHELAWMKLRAEKGWLPEGVAQRMRDFIKHKQLFGEFVEFTRKRK